MLEAEHLKFQLQPHTLGNVVSTLNAIAKNLHRGTESLAESLNYILYKGNNHLVTVEEEISFIKKYIQLNQLLYSDIISTTIDDLEVSRISKFFNTPCIPHLISAYLVENAYKHGDKTHPDFLKIVLKLSDYSFEMVVVNRLNTKPSENKNGGLGLKNMEKRLELLHNGNYEINRSCNEQEYYSSLIIRFQNEQVESAARQGYRLAIAGVSGAFDILINRWNRLLGIREFFAPNFFKNMLSHYFLIRRKKVAIVHIYSLSGGIKNSSKII